MYKKMIDEIAERKAKQIEDHRKQVANLQRMEKAKYDTSELFVGNLSRIITTKFRGKVYFKKLTDEKLRIFRYTALDTFQDIETEKYYPLVADGEVPKESKYCLLEASLQGFESACIDVIDQEQIDCDSKLTKSQLRQIVDKQNRIDENRFSI